MSLVKTSNNLHFWHLTSTITSFLLLLLLLHGCFALNPDGASLLSFKYNILSDPSSVLENWNYLDKTPCSWKGVTCEADAGKYGPPESFPVIGLALPNSQLAGSVPPDLGMIQHLRYLDLSNNFFNGSLPEPLFNASELRALSLANNRISGELPAAIGGLRSLSFLNLSGNFFAGEVPGNLSALRNLSVVSLRGNLFSGRVPSGFDSVQVLDLSTNLLNGSFPVDFGGGRLSHMNLSHNNLSGTIPPQSVMNIPSNATVDLSFNNLTGEIPKNGALWNQNKEFFAGNGYLCGKPLKILCSFPSPNPNASISSSPAIAVIPKGSKPVDTNPERPHEETQQERKSSKLKPGTIAGIAVGDLAGIGILAIIFLSLYQIKKKRGPHSINKDEPTSDPKRGKALNPFQSENSLAFRSACPCLVKNGEETPDVENDAVEEEDEGSAGNVEGSKSKLVMVDGGEMEMETLLKAAAYVVSAAGRSIIYRAVLEDGAALAVRRMESGEWCGGGLKEFESHVRVMAKLRHPNLVRVRGFYWGPEEKLLICDYVSNGSLAAITHRKHGSSSPCHLPLQVRLKIARGVARGLTYIHDKKHVHGNLKPSNVLLTPDMEPIISDFGLDRLLMGCNRPKSCGSSRAFDSKPTTPIDGPQNVIVGRTPLSSNSSTCPYHAPESLKNVKPNRKWDVYSFGILLLMLLTGKEFSERELGQWAAGPGSANRVLELPDVAIMDDVASREDATLAGFKLGLGCAAVAPQKRPSMKEVLQALESLL